MELSFELGIPFGRLSRSLTEKEFQAYGKYASRRSLPAQRVEYVLSQIACLIAQTMGGVKDVKPSDFMLGFNQPEEITDELEAMKIAFGFNPIRKRSG